MFYSLKNDDTILFTNNNKTVMISNTTTINALDDIMSLNIQQKFISYSTLIFCYYLPIFISSFVFGRNKTTKTYWDLFTRGVSTCNAINCVWLVSIWVFPNYNKYFCLNYQGDVLFTNGMFLFSSYLFVDGVFYLPQFLFNPSVQMLTTILHHFVGGLGIYVIASLNRGLGLAAYFAWTEVSTPLLHMSWLLYSNNIKNMYSKMVFGCFYITFFLVRIVSIPTLLKYLYVNYQQINQDPLFHRIMVYGGSGTLICLNVIWFTILTLKLKKLFCSN